MFESLLILINESKINSISKLFEIKMTLLPVLSLKQAKTYKMSHFFEVTHSKL